MQVAETRRHRAARAAVSSGRREAQRGKQHSPRRGGGASAALEGAQFSSVQFGSSPAVASPPAQAALENEGALGAEQAGGEQAVHSGA